MIEPEQGRHRNSTTERIPVYRGDYTDVPTDPSMRIPYNTAPRRPSEPQQRYQDLIIPRYFLEPDEAMDALRQRSLRWAIIRDRMAVLTMLLVVGSFTRPVFVFLAEAIR